MIIDCQSARDGENVQGRLKNLIDAVGEGRHISLMLEPTSLCNLTCHFCNLHSEQSTKVVKGKGVMRLELYQLILDEIANLGYRFETVFFQGNGEPLLHEHIVDMISMAVKREISKRYVLFTNGTLMKPRLFDRLMSSGIDEINVSLDTINPSVYKEVKGKNLLADVLRNIDYGIKRVLESPAISLIIKTCEGGSIYGIGDENCQQIIDKYKAEAANSQHIHIKKVPIVERADDIARQKKEFHEPCEIPFYLVLIKHDGRVSPCCIDARNTLNIGKIGSDKSLKDILGSQRLRKIRQIHLSGNLDEIPLCKHCANRTVVNLSDYRYELSPLI